MRARTTIAVPLLLAFVTGIAGATDIAPTVKASILDQPIDGFGDSFNLLPFTGLITKSSPQTEARAIQEFNVTMFTGVALQSAILSGTISTSSSMDVGLRTFDFLLYTANGSAQLTDFQIAATFVGSGSYHPPTASNFTYSFDVTPVVNAMLNHFDNWIGLRVVCTSDPSEPNILDDVTSKLAMTVGVVVGLPFCVGSMPSALCPCGNNNPAGWLCGCQSSVGLGACLMATGTASLANDTVVLRGTHMPNSSALYFQGTMQASGGQGTVFGDGLRCATGVVARLGTNLNMNNASQYPAMGQLPVHSKGSVLTPGTRYYQVWYRNAAPFCSVSTFNLTNGWTIMWTL